MNDKERLMTREERQRAMEFIVQQQAKNEVELERINESFRKAEHRFDRDEQILKLMIKAGERARRQIREHDELWTRQQAELVESGKHTDRRLDALIDIVRADRNRRTGSV